MKRIISIFLLAAILVSLLPLSALATVKEDDFSITASGGDKTITVTEKSSGGNDTGGSVQGEKLSLSVDPQTTIQRDYEQSVKVKVTNTSDQAVEYYLGIVNTNEDIYMNFVSSGSADAPLTIPADATQEVLLSVFAQNAQKTSYTVQVKAFVTGENNPLEMGVTFACAASGGSVTFSDPTVDPSTLTTTYTVTNTGTEKITDLTLSITGDAAGYVRISPSVENYELGANQNVTVKLIPDLGKMKDTNKTEIIGKLVASGGASAETNISFNTNGEKITSMTMGQLALYQDGNPLYNLAIKEDSLSVKVINDKGETDINSYVQTNGKVDTVEEIDKVLDVIVDKADATFNVSYGSSYVYGENNESSMDIDIQVSAKALKTAPMSIQKDKEYYTYDKSSGTVTYTETYYLTPEQYLKMLTESTYDLGSYLSIQDWTGKGYEVLNPDAEAYEVKIVESIVDPTLWKSFGIDNALPAVFDNKIVGEFGQIGDCFSTASDIISTYTMLTDPNIDNGTKTYYTGLTIAKNVLRWGKEAVAVSPLDGAGYIGCLLGELFIDWLLEDLDTELNSSGIHYDIYGRQCTNVGRVTSDFYVPDFRGKQDKVTIYETGRMYDGSPYGGNAGYAEDQFGGDNYIHNRDVRYDYILNGKKVGETKNNGLTAVSIAKLDGSALKPGNNTLVRDYNTNAGHYSVVADTEITILYPADTEISYIGNPEGLEDVRLLPDFAVYGENILPAAAIIGEETQVTVYVYNRGSKGGWVDISVGDGTNMFASEPNVRIDAFSEKAITFNWIPTTETTEFTVTLENKSVNLNERKYDNNTATRTVTARSREVPEIGYITPSEVVLDGSTVRFIAEITKIADVKSVSFEVNGTAYTGVSLTALSDTTAQASVGIGSSTLRDGENRAKAIVTYNTGATTTATVEKTVTFTGEAPSSVSFSVDGTVKNPVFSVMRNDGSSVLGVGVTDAAGGSEYALTNNAATHEHPENYYLLTVCDGGLIVTPLNTLSDSTTLSLNGGTAITINSGDAALVEVTLMSLNRNSLNSPYPVLRPDSGNKLLLSGVTAYRMHIKYKIADMVGYAYIYENNAVNSTIDLSNYYKLYQINMPVDRGYTAETHFDGNIWYTALEGQSSSYNIYNNTKYDSSTNQLTVLVTDSYQIDELSDATDVQAILTIDGNTVYVVDLYNYSGPVSAAWNHYRVSFSCVQANTVNVSGTELAIGNYASYLWDDTFYLPAGTYSFMVNYEADRQRLYHTDALEISGQDVTVALPGPTANPTTATFMWPSVWDDDAYLGYHIMDTEGNHWNPYALIAKGESVALPKGNQRVSLQLNRISGRNQIAYASFALDLTLTENSNTNVTIGNIFTGDADIANRSYEAGTSCWAGLSNLIDGSGAELTHYSANNSDGYLNGRITLTNRTDPSKVYTVSFSENQIGYGNDIYFSLPKDMAAGKYNYEVFLTSAKVGSTQYTITFNANGGSGTMTGITVNTGETYVLPTCDFVAPANKEFKAWRIDGIEYNPGYVYTVTKDITISAVWVNKVTGGNTPNYNIDTPSNVDNGSITVTPTKTFAGGTVTITVTPDKGYELDKLAVTDAKGSNIELISKGNGKYTFKMPASKVTIHGSFKAVIQGPDSSANPFTDVSTNSYFYDAVLWAVENGITKGTGDSNFSPDDSCTRAQMVTFLWRAAGSPELGSNTDSFTDIIIDAYYAKAVQWAIEQGITNGTGDGTFSPNDSCTRAQMVTFLWRMAGSPEPVSSVSSFMDVAADTYYAAAVQWAVEKGITTGTGNGMFSPDSICTRAQTVTLLYRYFVN